MSISRSIVAWEDVEDAAKTMFNVWFDGSEFEWARECWGHFTNAGLTSDVTPLELTRTYLRLLILARVYREFCELAWDEDASMSLCYLAEDLNIDPLSAGILAGTSPAGELADLEEVSDDHHLFEAAIEAATPPLRKQIFDCLCAAYGDAIKLYTRMSKTNQPTPSEAVPDEADDNLDEFDCTIRNVNACSFVTNGFTNN